MYQDHYGYIWIATISGLVKYDGNTFKTYHPNQGPYNLISDQFFLDIYESRNKVLYFGTRSVGLVKYDHSKDSFNDFVDTPVQRIPHSVNSIAEDQRGRIWTSGLTANFLYDPLSNKSTRYDNKGSSKHFTLVNNTPYFYYSGSDFNGLCKIKDEEPQCIKTLTIEFILQMPEKKNELWIGTKNGGLLLFDTDKNTWENLLPNTQFVSALINASDDFLFTTSKNKLGLFNTKTKSVNPLNGARITSITEANPHDLIELMLKDASENIWAVSNKQLIKIRYSKFLREIELNREKSIRTYNIVEDNNHNLWVATKEKGIISYNLNNQKINNIMPPQFTSFDATALINGPDNSLFIGSRHGVFRYFIKTNEWIQYNIKPRNHVSGLALTDDQHLLAGSDMLHKINIDTGAVKSFDQNSGVIDDNIVHIESLNNNNFLLGSTKISNVFIFNAKTNQSIQIQDKSFDPDKSFDTSRDAVFTNKGELWINGVSKQIKKVVFPLTNNNKFETYEIVHNDAIVNILSIIDDKNGNLWLGTNVGIVYFDTDSMNYQVYAEDDGFPSQGLDSRSIFTAENGNIYFGARGSIIEINPSNIDQATYSPNVVITEVAINDTPHLVQEAFHLQPADKSISFSFASLDFYNPDGIKYRYQLVDFENDWRYTSNNNQAHYTNLPPGNYVFRVEGTNGRGIWSEKFDSIELTVAASVWQSSLAKLFYVVSLLAFIYFLLQFRTRRLRRKAMALEKEVSERTGQIEQLLERKNTLFSHISHELRTPLTLIIGPLNKAIKILSKDKKSEVSGSLGIALNNTNRLIHIVEQLLSLSRANAVDQDKKVVRNLHAIIKYIISSVDSYAEENKVKLSLEIDKSVSVNVIENSLETIFLNLIVNAIKYASDGGWVKVVSSINDGRVKISVSDNGPGIADSKKSLIFKQFSQIDENSEGLGIGLALVKELLEVQSGTIELVSEDGNGATFNIELPIYDLDRSSAVDYKATLPLNTESIENHLSLSTEYYQLRESNSLEKNIENSAFATNSRKRRVLIVEDNIEMCNYLFDLLSNDYSCAIAYNGNQGYEIAMSESPDLIISDLMMPEMNGIQLTQELRNSSQTAHIPIVLLTAQGSDQVRIDAYSHNPDDFIVKPFRDEELLTRIESIFSVREILKQEAFRDFKSKAENKRNDHENKNTAYTFDDINNAINVNDKNINKIFLNELDCAHERHFKESNLTLSDIASILNMTSRSLQRKVKAATGVSPLTYLRTFRLEQAAQLMEAGNTSIKNIQAEIGMTKNVRFYEYFKEYTGKTPSEYIANFFEAEKIR